MTSCLYPAVEMFTANQRAVFELMNFDELVLELPIRQLERVAEHQRRHQLVPHLTVEKPLQLLRNVRQNASLKPYFEEMYNQCLVLLVSHFGSAVRALFVSSVQESIAGGATPALLKEEIRLSLGELRRADSSIAELAGEYLADRKDLSFQDMQSIGRAFKELLGYNRPRDAVTNDIIVVQACRHAVVHNSAMVDRRLLSQVGSANPRSLKTMLQLGEKIVFDPTEIQRAAAAMHGYLLDLSEGVEKVRLAVARADLEGAAQSQL